MRDLYNPYSTSEPCNPLSGIGPAVELFGTTLVPSLRPLGTSLPAGFHAQLKSDSFARGAHPLRRIAVGSFAAFLALSLWIGQSAESVQAETPQADSRALDLPSATQSDIGAISDQS
ncbi:hypothetical protein CMO84_02945 [Candidatus Woesearchaeota archaeon]|jgi:hypothetical protein|nr:hypothetical protein [Candidatus Woesearchaeota archaeon]MDP6738986.1 hypothetical protein [Planctomycetota bacterium]MDP6939690.1 hypothetical protein [Planctomycetota bacterium]